MITLNGLSQWNLRSLLAAAVRGHGHLVEQSSHPHDMTTWYCLKWWTRHAARELTTVEQLALNVLTGDPDTPVDAFLDCAQENGLLTLVSADEVRKQERQAVCNWLRKRATVLKGDTGHFLVSHHDREFAIMLELVADVIEGNLISPQPKEDN